MHSCTISIVEMEKMQSLGNDRLYEKRHGISTVTDVPYTMTYFVHICIVYVGLAQAHPNYCT